MARYATHRSPRSLLGPRAGAPAPARKAAPTPRSLREYRQRTKRLMEERLKRRHRQVARKLGLLPPTPPPRPKLPKPPPAPASRQQRAKQARHASQAKVWDAMEEAAQDKIDLAPRSGPPAWDASSPTKGQIRSPDRLPAMRGSHAAEDAAAEAGPSEVEKLAEQSRRYHAEVDRARAAYAATLTPGQLAAGLLDDIAPHCLATQFRLIGNRGDRRFWR